jgi:hypothetical protein
MLNISPPLSPQLNALTVCALSAGGVALGAAMLLWGRILSRPFLALVGVATAIAFAGSLSQQFSVTPLVAATVAAVAFAAVGAVTARILWALAAGAVFGAAAILAMLAHMTAPAAATAAQPTSAPGHAPFVAWLADCWNYCGAALGEAWKDRSATVLWTLCLGGGGPLTVALLLPRLGKIFMTSLLGAVCVVGGVLLAVVKIQESLWPATWWGYALPLTAVAVLLMFGIVYQFCGAILEERAKQDKKAKGGEKKPEKKPSDNAAEKKK